MAGAITLSAEDLADPDVWDDTELIEAYNEAVRQAMGYSGNMKGKWSKKGAADRAERKKARPHADPPKRKQDEAALEQHARDKRAKKEARKAAAAAPPEEPQEGEATVLSEASVPPHPQPQHAPPAWTSAVVPAFPSPPPGLPTQLSVPAPTAGCGMYAPSPWAAAPGAQPTAQPVAAPALLPAGPSLHINLNPELTARPELMTLIQQWYNAGYQSGVATARAARQARGA